MSTYRSRTRSEQIKGSQRTRAKTETRQSTRNTQRRSYAESSYSQAQKLKRGTFTRNNQMIIAVLAVLALVIVGRLAWLTLIDGPRLAESATKMRTSEEVLEAKRGTIYDRNGAVLAISVEAKTICANPRQLQKNNQVSKAEDILVEKLGGNAEDYHDKLTKDTTFVYIEKKVELNQATECMSELSHAGIGSVYAEPAMKRAYPYGSVGAQVLGLVSDEGQGICGLELQYNDLLKGKDGKLVHERGADGEPIAGSTYSEEPSVDGTDLVISLDIKVQQVAEENIASGQKHYSAKSGMVTVTNPENGEILAMCSTPLLNMDNVSADATTLKCISMAYEPGSVMKVLTAAIGEDAGTFNNNTVYNVPLTLKIGDHDIHDAEKRAGAEDMTISDIITLSSNIGAALMGKNIGVNTFSSGLRQFGIGQKTGVDYPGETAGMMPSAEKMTSIDLQYMAFGQSLTVSQLQLVRAVGALAHSGKLTTPHFAVYKGTQKIEWPEGSQACTEETAQNVTDMMRNVVTKGTARSAQIKGYDIAAKTGTGEQAVGGKYAGNSYLSSLIGYAPATGAKVEVCVSLEGVAYLAGESAAPLWADIVSQALQDLGISPDA